MAQEINKLRKFEELPVSLILKVEKCSYVNETELNESDSNQINKWYICSCSERDLSLICKECANNCHFHHEGKVELTNFKLSNPICKCGKFSHKISEELESSYKNNTEKLEGRCFISDLSSKSLNKGVYCDEDLHICYFCYINCYTNDQSRFKFKEESHLGGLKNICQCEHHKKVNFLYFSTTTIYKLSLSDYVFKYNFNIFRTIPYFNTSFFVSNNNKIGESSSGDTSNLNKIFNEFSLVNIVKCFNKINKKHHRKYDYLMNYFDKLDINKFFQNLRDQSLTGKDENFFNLQALLINIIFNTYIKSKYVKQNNQFGFDAIINMNPFQRNFFLLKSINFPDYSKNPREGSYSHMYKQEKIVSINDVEFVNFIDSVLNLSDNFIKQIGNIISQKNFILDKYFKFINKMFKFLIKYRLISDDKRFKFFEIVLDSFTLCSTGNFIDLSNSSYYLIRTCFYCFLYKNDSIIIKSLEINDNANLKKSLKDFSFTCSEDTDILSKIFINCINKFDRKNNLKTIKFDYYIKKIFDILLQRDDFYLKSLKNLFFLDGLSLNQFIYPDQIIKEKNIEENLNLIFPIINDIGLINRAFLNYEIDYSIFLNNISSVVRKLKDLIDNYILAFEIDMSMNLKQFYLKIINRKEYEKSAMLDLQKTIRYTQFYQVFYELFSIYEQVLTFYKDCHQLTIPHFERELLKFLLKLLYISFENNEENFALFLTFDSNHLIKIFFLFEKEFNLFLKIIFTKFFRKIGQSTYIINDNRYFSNLMNNLIVHVEKLADDELKIRWFCRIMKFLQKTLKYLNILDLDLISAFQHLFKAFNKFIIDNYPINEEELNLIHNLNLNRRESSKELKQNPLYKEKYENLKKKHEDDFNSLKNKHKRTLALNKFFNECFKKCYNVVPKEDLKLHLFSKYIMLLNGIYFNGFYFLDMFQECVIIEINTIEEILFNIKCYNLPLHLEIEFTRYYELFKFFPNFKISQSDDILQNMYLSNSETFHHFDQKYEKIYSFNQLQNILCNPQFIIEMNYKKYDENFNSGPVNTIDYQAVESVLKNCDLQRISFDYAFHAFKCSQMEKICYTLDFLLILLKRFESVVDKFLSEDSSQCTKLISIFNYYENSILRPLFFTINSINEHNMILIEKMSVKELFKIFEVTANFLKSTVILYEKTSSINIEYIELLNRFSELDFDVFPKIPIKIILPSKNINQLKSMIIDFKTEKIKYFEFKEIISVLTDHIKSIVSPDIDEFDYKSNIKSESGCDLDNFETIKNLPNKLFQKIMIINKSYQKKKIQTFDDDLCLIKGLDSSMGNFKARKIIINYLKDKNMDNITSFSVYNDSNIKTNFRRDYKLYPIQMDEYNLQNYYSIYYLSLILNNDSKKCQNFLSTSYSQESTISFITSYIKYNIFGNLLYELIKFNEIDNIKEYAVISRSKITHEIITSTLKFLQNLCEGHNKEFQTIMFNIYLMNKELKPKFIESCETFKTLHAKLIETHSKETRQNATTDKNAYATFNSYKGVRLSEEKIKYDNNAMIKIKDYNEENNKDVVEENNFQTQNKYNEDQLNCNIFVEERQNSTSQEEGSRMNTRRSVRNIYINDAVITTHERTEENVTPRINDEFYHNLPYKPTSFPNLIFTSMRIILNNIQHNTNKNCEDIVEIYQKFSDLTVEIIQGTPAINLQNFFMEIHNVTLYESKDKKIHYDNFIYFQFVNLCHEIKEILYDFNILDSILINIKYNLFFILTNILNSQNLNRGTAKLFEFIFDPKKLIELISKYLIVIFLKHVDCLNIDDPEFAEKYITLDLDKDMILRLLEKFRLNNQIFSDDIYKLSAQIYLFITILGEKYKNVEATSILKFFFDKSEKEQDEESVTPDEVEIKRLSLMKKKVHIKKEDYQSQETIIKQTNDLTQQKIVSIQSLNLAGEFFKESIKSCEFFIPTEDDEEEDDFDWEYFDFMQDKSDNEDDDKISGIQDSEINSDDDVEKGSGDEKVKEPLKTLKKIYFIVDPKVYMISDTNIKNFFENADRTNATNKLKYLLKSLDDFYIEVKYKLKIVENSEKMKKLFQIDYMNVDLANLIFSMIIVFILLGFLNEDTIDSFYVFGTLIFIETLQVSMNIIFLVIFYQSKYNFYISKEKNHNKDCNLTKMQRFEIFIVKSFLLNDEVYLLILNILIGVIVLLRPSFIGLFILQLFTVVKFFPTIQQIVEAFRIRIFQLLNMLGFLGILTYFYANMSFYFFSGEFLKVTDSGLEENLCQTLSECFITFFNHGVRSGGGIADLLEMRSSDNPMFLPRYLLDLIFYITVILLLLNMINGVIVSTFSQIREDSTKKEEDKENMCYICSIKRGDFEKEKIPFKEHIKIDHNYITYIQFLIYLKFFNEKDMDSDQSYIISCIKNKDIGCFPIRRALAMKKEIKEDNTEN